MEFTRAGLTNPQGRELRSSLQRVALLCAKNQLVRRIWNHLDIPKRQIYQDKILLFST